MENYLSLMVSSKDNPCPPVIFVVRDLTKAESLNGVILIADQKYILAEQQCFKQQCKKIFQKDKFNKQINKILFILK